MRAQGMHLMFQLESQFVCGFSEGIHTQSKEYAKHDCIEHERVDTMQNLTKPTQYYKHFRKCVMQY